MELDLRHTEHTGFLLRSMVIFFLAGLILPKESPGAFEPKRIGSRYIGAGYTGLVSAADLFSTHVNPAKMAGVTGYRLDLFYRDYYGLESVHQRALDCRLTIGKIPLGLAVTTFGSGAYQETDLAFAAAFAIGGLSLGIGVHWYHLSIYRYGSAGVPGLCVGGIHRVTESLGLGFNLINISSPRIGAGKEQLPGSLELGMEYVPVPGVHLRLEISKTDGYSFEYRYGMEYLISEGFIVLCGYNNPSEAVCMGTVVSFRGFEVSYAADYHMVLGLSNTVSISYEF